MDHLPSFGRFISIKTPLRGTVTLETRHIGAEHIPATDSAAPLMVFLHEGLGSAAQWRGWPEHLCRETKARGLVYSRYGYGRSTPRPEGEQWNPDYLLEQARDHLPALLDTLGFAGEQPWLFGHSDGGTIALLYAALYPDCVQGIAVAAPHVFVEPETLAAIAAVRDDYERSGLRQRLAHYHADPDSAFGGWSNAWLNPPFAQWDIRPLLTAIRCPVLAVQGDADEYASLRQIDDIAAAVPGTETRVLENCGHILHRDRPDVLARTVADWMRRHRPAAARPEETRRPMPRKRPLPG